MDFICQLELSTFENENPFKQVDYEHKAKLNKPKSKQNKNNTK